MFNFINCEKSLMSFSVPRRMSVVSRSQSLKLSRKLKGAIDEKGEVYERRRGKEDEEVPSILFALHVRQTVLPLRL